MLNESLLNKLEKLTERREEIHALLSDPAVIRDKDRFRELGKEVAEINPVIECYNDVHVRHPGK